MSEKFHSGYVLLSRSLQESNLWQLPPDHFRVAVYLLMKARHKAKPHRLPDGLEIKRGEMVTSMTLIAENCSYYENRMVREMSRKKALNILENLENIGFLKRNSHSKGTHLTICNYDTYQTAKNYNLHADETDREQSGNSEGTLRDTNKKVNNDKNEENEKKESDSKKQQFDDAFKSYGEKGSRQVAMRIWFELPESDRLDIVAAIPSYVSATPDEKFRKSFQNWIEPEKKHWLDKLPPSKPVFRGF